MAANIVMLRGHRLYGLTDPFRAAEVASGKLAVAF